MIRRYNNRSRVRTSALAAAATSCALAVLLTACSSSGSKAGSGGSATGAASGGSTTGSTSAAVSTTDVDGIPVAFNPQIAATVPAQAKAEGLKDITFNNAPPDEFVQDGTTVGWEPDMANAVAATLGLKISITTSPNFAEFIPGLQSGRFNVSFTSLIVTPDRVKVIDIVSLLNAGTAFVTSANSSLSVNAITDLCGQKVAALQGSSFLAQLATVNGQCTSAGKKGLDVLTFPNNTAGQLAVTTGRAAAFAASTAVVSYLASKQPTQFKLQPLNFQPVPEGVGVTKNSGLSQPITDAVNALIKSGVYAQILMKWGVTQGQITKSEVHSS